MTQKQTIKLDCLFLHNTQMADLEKEQGALRLSYAQTHTGPENALPFNFLPPFCVGKIAEGCGILTIGAPENCGGWIVRPVNALSAAKSAESCFPLYPPLPAVAGFILGYAGKAAGACIPETARAFTVKVWYHARMTVNIEYEEGKLYAVFRETGTETWAKAVR